MAHPEGLRRQLQRRDVQQRPGLQRRLRTGKVRHVLRRRHRCLGQEHGPDVDLPRYLQPVLRLPAGFRKGSWIDCGPSCALSSTCRAHFGDLLEGTVTVGDFGGAGSATGKVAEILERPPVKPVQRLNQIRGAVPCQHPRTQGVTVDPAFKRRRTSGSTDSSTLVTVSGADTYSGVPNDTYTDAVAGDEKTGTDGPAASPHPATARSALTSWAARKGRRRRPVSEVTPVGRVRKVPPPRDAWHALSPQQASPGTSTGTARARTRRCGTCPPGGRQDLTDTTLTPGSPNPHGSPPTEKDRSP